MWYYYSRSEAQCACLGLLQYDNWGVDPAFASNWVKWHMDDARSMGGYTSMLCSAESMPVMHSLNTKAFLMDAIQHMLARVNTCYQVCKASCCFSLWPLPPCKPLLPFPHLAGKPLVLEEFGKNVTSQDPAANSVS